jgi:lauroyl/myristoyl acyltransferase
MLYYRTICHIAYRALLQGLSLPLAAGLWAVGWKKQTVLRNCQRLSIAPQYFTVLHNLAFDVWAVIWGYLPAPIQIDQQSQTNLEALKNSGGIMLCAHLGNFELMGLVLRTMLPMQASYIPLKNKWANHFMLRLRHRDGVFSYAYKGLEPILTHVRKQGVFTFLADQDYRNAKPIQSKFFGHTLHRNPLPVTVHKRTRCAVYFVYMYKELGHYHLKVQCIASAHSTAQPMNGRDLYQGYDALLQKAVQKVPWQYYNLTHRMWYSAEQPTQ